MDGYKFVADLDEGQRRRVMATYFAPGDLVRPGRNVRGGPDGEIVRKAAEGDGTLRVRAVVVTEDQYVKYEFEGLEGRFGNGNVEDARETVQIYGALVRVDDQTWAVELNGDSDRSEAIRAFRIAGEPERHVKWGMGLASEAELAAFAAEDGGASGEFILADREDGSWSLVAVPWASGLSDREISIARSAVESAIAGTPRLQ